MRWDGGKAELSYHHPPKRNVSYALECLECGGSVAYSRQQQGHARDRQELG